MELQNIKVLTTLIEALGFSASMGKKIVYYCCLHQKEFSINERKSFGDDVMNYQIFFKENNATGKLVCTHYDAFLRKNISMKSLRVDNVDLHKLDERMKSVNWDELSQFRELTPFDLSDKESWKHFGSLEEIILDLEKLASTDEGRIVGDNLKYKYWIDSPLENLIPNLYLLKSKIEYTQRFYIIGENGITADEAFRFLNNKWMQRQVQSKKQDDVNVEVEYATSQKPLKRIKSRKRETKAK